MHESQPPNRVRLRQRILALEHAADDAAGVQHEHRGRGIDGPNGALRRGQGASVYMPRIGCGLAGGTRAEIGPIVQETLGDQRIPVTVYDLAAGGG